MIEIQTKYKEMIKFGAVGVFATLLHWAIYYFILYLLGDLASNKIYTNFAYFTGYSISLIANFYLTTYFTFKSTVSFRKFAGFCAAHGVNMLLHFLLLNLFLYLGVSEKVANIPVFLIAVPINFLLVRFVFKKNNKKEDESK